MFFASLGGLCPVAGRAPGGHGPARRTDGEESRCRTVPAALCPRVRPDRRSWRDGAERARGAGHSAETAGNVDRCRQGGRILGKTDARAERPASDPYGPEDLCATMYHLLGIDPESEFYTPEGRPVKVVNNGRIIHDLL